MLRVFQSVQAPNEAWSKPALEQLDKSICLTVSSRRTSTGMYTERQNNSTIGYQLLQGSDGLSFYFTAYDMHQASTEEQYMPSFGAAHVKAYLPNGKLLSLRMCVSLPRQQNKSFSQPKHFIQVPVRCQTHLEDPAYA